MTRELLKEAAEALRSVFSVEAISDCDKTKIISQKSNQFTPIRVTFTKGQHDKARATLARIEAALKESGNDPA